MNPTTYTCSSCGAPASVKDGKVVRTCECTGPVAANISAVAVGQATVK